MTRAAALAAVLAGCSTGPAAPPPAAPRPAPVRHHAPFELALERTACFGMCPVYKLVIHPDGDVEWNGIANVAELGVRHSHISAARMDELARALAAAQFDERDETGHLPVSPSCSPAAASGGGGGLQPCTDAMTYSGCTDTPHTIISVRRGSASHVVDDAHCDPSPLDHLEHRIDELTHTEAWIAR